MTNDDAPEFRLVDCPVPLEADQDHHAWREVRPEDPEERLERVDAFAGHVVMSLRSGYEHRLRIVPADDLAGPGIVLASRFPAGAVHIARNTAYDASVVTVVDRAHVEPPVWSDVDLGTGQVEDRLPGRGHPGTIRPGTSPSGCPSRRRTGRPSPPP